MFRRIKDLFSQHAEEVVATCGMDELPGLLESLESDSAATERENTRDQRTAIRQLRSDLSAMVQNLASKEREEAYHPKLETIAKNTLPQFERAMLSSLGKELPEDPGEFYLAATDSLKGCVKGLAGPGRYLRGVFPDEMKEIRETVDLIGREMNAMTPVIATARSRRARIAGIRADLARFHAAVDEQITGMAEVTGIRQDIENTERERILIRDQIREIQEAVEHGVLKREKEELLHVQQAYHDEERALHADLAVLLHVYRKGEKVLGRIHGAAAAKEIEAVVHMLSGTGIPEEGQLQPNLVRTLPPVMSMIASGEIALKNKEEKEIFSGDCDISARVREGYARTEGARIRFQGKERAYQDHPLQADLRAARKKDEALSLRIATQQSRLLVLTDRNEVLEKEIALVFEKIRSGIRDLTGKDVVRT
jgi:hypothetical protein